MWACYCGNCKDSLVCYTIKEPKAGDRPFYEDFYHKDFSPLKDKFDEPFCEKCGRHFPSNMLIYIEECKRVFDLNKF